MLLHCHAVSVTRGNSCVRCVTPDGIVSTVVPGGVVTQPYDLDISHKGELVVTDAYQGVLHVFDLSLQRPDHIKVPRSSYTARMVDLLETGEAADVTFQVSADGGQSRANTTAKAAEQSVLPFRITCISCV